MVEHLPSKHKALSLNASTAKKQTNKQTSSPLSPFPLFPPLPLFFHSLFSFFSFLYVFHFIVVFVNCLSNKYIWKEIREADQGARTR
jgi:hypothetical protein